MNKKNRLNLAILIIGISIIVLGGVMLLTLPDGLKENFNGFHGNRFSMEKGDWSNKFNGNSSDGYYNHMGSRSHGGIWILPSIIIVVLIAVGFRKKSNRHFHGHGGHECQEKPVDVLRRSYAAGRMTRYEYLERKSTLENDEEVSN